MKPPAPLGPAGRRLWAEVLTDFELSAAERRVLREACATVDAIARLEGLLDGVELLVAGSRGQQVLHPAVAEVRQQRAALSRLLAQLQLPDDTGRVQVPSALSQRGRQAAQTRWGARGA